MSYVCQLRCQKAQPAGSRPNRVVVARRSVDYRVFRGKKKIAETQGYEIVSEVNGCQPCKDKLVPLVTVFDNKPTIVQVLPERK